MQELVTRNNKKIQKGTFSFRKIGWDSSAALWLAETDLGHLVIGCGLVGGVLEALFELRDEQVVAVCVGNVDLLLTGQEHLLSLETHTSEQHCWLKTHFCSFSRVSDLGDGQLQLHLVLCFSDRRLQRRVQQEDRSRSGLYDSPQRSRPRTAPYPPPGSTGTAPARPVWLEKDIPFSLQNHIKVRLSNNKRTKQQSKSTVKASLLTREKSKR